jgi:adenylate cyclase
MLDAKVLRRLLAGTIISVVSALFVWGVMKVSLPTLFYGYEAKTLDWRFQWRAFDAQRSELQVEDIVIVDVDGRSVNKLGKFSQWDRKYYSHIIDYMSSGGAIAIAFDILFDPDRDKFADSLFIESVKKANNVYTAIYFAYPDSDNFLYKMDNEPPGIDWNRFYYTFDKSVRIKFNSRERLEATFPKLIDASFGAPAVNVFPDDDGVIRWAPLFINFNEHYYPTLGFRIMLDLLGISPQQIQEGKAQIEIFPNERLDLKVGNEVVKSIPMNNRGEILVNFVGFPKTFRYISFYDVLEERIPKEFFANKVILVGTTLPGLFDLKSVSVHPIYPGVEIHANVIYQILNDNFIKTMKGWQIFLMVLIFAIVIGLMTIFLKPIPALISVSAIIAGYIIVAFYSFLKLGFWLEIIPVIGSIFITFLGIFIYKYAVEDKEKRMIRGTFSLYVTKSVVDQLLSHPELIKLGGEKKECTVFFSDVAGFTTISEQLTPEALVHLLNEYLTAMTNIVLKYDGMLDKYEGDAVMAVFGAPVPHPDDPVKACLASLEMQEVLAQMREKWRREGKPELRARIGLNTGPMVVGNMGSETRFNYTVMGDSVNLGSRLEGANKNYGTYIMMGELTYEKVKDAMLTRQLDLLRVKGKTEPVKVYELLAKKEDGLPANKTQAIESYNVGLENYFLQKWEIAISYFQKALEVDSTDEPSKVYIKRCKEFMKEPPGSDWDGVYTLTTK